MSITNTSEPTDPGASLGSAGHEMRAPGREQGLVTELQHLARLSDATGCLETQLRELSRSAARLLGAERCIIMLPSGDGAAPIQADAEAGCADGELSAPIRVSGQGVGVVRVSGARGKPGFDDEDRRMLELVTVHIGKSLQILQLQRLLRSRFAQLSLVHGIDEPVGPLLTGVPHFARMVRILAKSFYHELRKAGLGTNEVIAAVSQIIAEVSADLKRGGRHDRPVAEPMDAAAQVWVRGTVSTGIAGKTMRCRVNRVGAAASPAGRPPSA